MTKLARKAAFAGAAAVPLALAGMVGSASAAGLPHPSGNVQTRIVRSADHPNIAFLTGSYKCFGGKGVLWASVKQGGPDPTAESSSQTVATWYDAHVLLTCNGKPHTLTVEINKHLKSDAYPAPKNYRTLYAGKAWIQWCVTQGKSETASNLSSTSKWGHVVKAVTGP
jgi:hypothetical protein